MLRPLDLSEMQIDISTANKLNFMLQKCQHTDNYLWTVKHEKIVWIVKELTDSIIFIQTAEIRSNNMKYFHVSNCFEDFYRMRKCTVNTLNRCLREIKLSLTLNVKRSEIVISWLSRHTNIHLHVYLNKKFRKESFHRLVYTITNRFANFESSSMLDSEHILTQIIFLRHS